MSHAHAAGTSAHVGISVYGSHSKSGPRLLEKLEAFQRGAVDTFCIATQLNLGDIRQLRIWHDNMGTDAAWYLSRVIIRDLQTEKTHYFLAKCWLTLEDENGSIEKRLYPAGACQCFLQVRVSVSCRCMLVHPADACHCNAARTHACNTIRGLVPE